MLCKKGIATRQKERSLTVSTSLLKVRLSVRGSHSNLPWPDLQWCNIISISLYKSFTPFLYAGTSIFICVYVSVYTWLRSYACVCLCKTLTEFSTLQLAASPAVGQKLWQPRQWQPRVIAKGNSASAGVTAAVQWPGKKQVQKSL